MFRCVYTFAHAHWAAAVENQRRRSWDAKNARYRRKRFGAFYSSNAKLKKSKWKWKWTFWVDVCYLKSKCGKCMHVCLSFRAAHSHKCTFENVLYTYMYVCMYVCLLDNGVVEVMWGRVCCAGGTQTQKHTRTLLAYLSTYVWYIYDCMCTPKFRYIHLNGIFWILQKYFMHIFPIFLTIYFGCRDSTRSAT